LGVAGPAPGTSDLVPGTPGPVPVTPGPGRLGLAVGLLPAFGSGALWAGSGSGSGVRCGLGLLVRRSSLSSRGKGCGVGVRSISAPTSRTMCPVGSCTGSPLAKSSAFHVPPRHWGDGGGGGGGWVMVDRDPNSSEKGGVQQDSSFPEPLRDRPVTATNQSGQGTLPEMLVL
jgi:hypothetical protein